MEKQAARTRIVFAGSPSTSWIFVICSLFSWWWWWAACLLLVGIISLALPSNAQLVASCCRRWTSPVEEKNIYNKREKIHRTSTPLEKVDTCGSRKRLWITRWWCWTSTMRGKKMLSFSGRIFSFLEVISVKGAALPPRGCLWTEPPILSDVIYEELLIRKLLLSQKLVKLRIGAVAPLNFGLNKIGSNWGPIFICGACNWCNNPISWAILPLRNFSPTPVLCIYSFLIGFFLLGLIAFSLFLYFTNSRLKELVPSVSVKDNVTQLDIILEAIHYIASLRSQLERRKVEEEEERPNEENMGRRRKTNQKKILPCSSQD